MAVKDRGIAVLAEVVAVLARHSNLRVTPVVEEDRGVVALTVRLRAEGEDGLQVVSLLHELQHVAKVANMRQLCADLQIDTERLQALLPAMHDDAPPHAVRHVTVEEIDAVVRTLTGDGGMKDDEALLESAVPKLVALGRALEGEL